MRYWQFRHLVCGLVFTCLAGCRAEISFPELHPLEGTISRAGRPMRGGGIIFLRDAGDPTGMIVNASVNEDGTFTGESSLNTHRGAVIRPGVPVGRFKAIYHPLSDGSVTGLESTIEEVFEFRVGPNRIDIVLVGANPKGVGEPRDDANPPDQPVTPNP